jgi:hypothetical protein
MTKNFIPLLLLAVFALEAGPAQGQTIANAKPLSEISDYWKKSGWEFEKGWNAVDDVKAVEVWGKKFEQAIASGNIQSPLKMVDFDSSARRSSAGVSSKQFAAGLQRGMQDGLKNIFKQFQTEGTSYAYRGVKQTEFGPAVLMRLLDAGGGCNYHLWQMGRRPDGTLVAIDLYIFITGESFSDTMRRIAIISTPKDDRSFLQRLVGVEKEMANNQRAILELMQAAQKQDFQGILDSHKKLPEKIQNEKFFLIAKMGAASKIDDKEYFASLKALQKHYPNDASANLANIDLFFLQKKYDEMHTCINNLEKTVGKDAHLNMLRAVGFLAQEDASSAMKSIDESLAIEPNLETPYWTRIQIAIQQNNFDEVNVTLKQLVTRFGYNEFAFAGNELYKDYIKSEQHTSFQKFLKAQFK